MQIKKKLYFLFFIILLLTNCEYFNLKTYKEWEESTKHKTEAVVYSAGFYRVGAVTTACYWKNQEKLSLENGVSAAGQSEATSIYVVGDNVYVGGFYEAPGPVTKACYWINGKLQDDIQLDNPGNPSRAESIFVINGAVFMAGNENNEACYWIDNIKYHLSVPTPTNPFRANSIYVVQDSSSKYRIYIAGTHRPGAQDEACYWSNGGENFISSGIAGSEAHSIFVYGDKIYTAGKLIGFPETMCYWGNNSVELTYPSGLSVFKSNILISPNGDIHFAVGASGPENFYWKNGKLKYYITDGRQLRSFYVLNDDVYFGGRDAGLLVSYWINDGNPINVDVDPAAIASWINSIFVTSE